ncbi:MAG: InlB B-repeat-containing protein [Candidatus Nanoarchaeia archaeon]|nr:InlB B-repeat-containing protein [Candidatus Nanoarchaeia archaeon]
MKNKKNLIIVLAFIFLAFVMQFNNIYASEVDDLIEEYNSAFSDRVSPKSFVSTINDQSITSSGDGRLRAYFDEDLGFVYILLSKNLQSQSFLKGSSGIGLKTAMLNVMKSPNLQQIKTRVSTIELYNKGVFKSNSELESEGQNLALKWAGISGLQVIFAGYDRLVNKQEEFIMVGKTTSGETFEKKYRFFFLDSNIDKFDSNLNYCVFNVKGSSDLEVSPCYYVTFLDESGNILEKLSVKKGENVVFNNIPKKSGYNFAGWDVSLKNIQSDITARPKYHVIQTTYRVTFVDDRKNVLKTDLIVAGNDAIAPTIPQKEGYTFVGWDNDFTNVQYPVNVQAIYEKNKFDIEFFVLDEKNVPLKNTEIIFKDLEKSFVTDDNGFVTFKLENGDYEYDLSLEGYYSKTKQNFNVNNNKKTINVILEKRSELQLGQELINSNHVVDPTKTNLIIDEDSQIQKVEINENTKGSVKFKFLKKEENSVEFDSNVTIKRNFNSKNNIKLEIPENTIMNVEDYDWNGEFLLPEVIDLSSDIIRNKYEIDLAIKVGTDSTIKFTNPVKITIPNEKNNEKVFWRKSGEDLNEVSQCIYENEQYQKPENDGICYYESGNDLVIWTYHFTEFAIGNSKSLFNIEARKIKEIYDGNDGIVAEINYFNFVAEVIVYNDSIDSISGTGFFTDILPSLGVKEVSFDNKTWLTVDLTNSSFKIDQLLSAVEDLSVENDFTLSFKARIHQEGYESFEENFIVHLRNATSQEKSKFEFEKQIKTIKEINSGGEKIASVDYLDNHFNFILENSSALDSTGTGIFSDILPELGVKEVSFNDNNFINLDSVNRNLLINAFLGNMTTNVSEQIFISFFAKIQPENQTLFTQEFNATFTLKDNDTDSRNHFENASKQKENITDSTGNVIANIHYDNYEANVTVNKFDYMSLTGTKLFETIFPELGIKKVKFEGGSWINVTGANAYNILRNASITGNESRIKINFIARIQPKGYVSFDQEFNVTFKLADEAESRLFFNNEANKIKNITNSEDDLLATINYNNYSAIVYLVNGSVISESGTGLFETILPSLGVKQVRFDNGEWINVVSENLNEILNEADISIDENLTETLFIEFEANIHPNGYIDFIQDFNVTFVVSSSDVARNIFEENAKRITEIKNGENVVVAQVEYENYEANVLVLETDYLLITGTQLFSKTFPNLGVKEVRFNSGEWIDVSSQNINQILSEAKIDGDESEVIVEFEAKIKIEPYYEFLENFTVKFTLNSEILARKYFNTEMNKITEIRNSNQEMVAKINYSDYLLDILVLEDNFGEISGTKLFSNIFSDLGIRKVSFNSGYLWIDVDSNSASEILGNLSEIKGINFDNIANQVEINFVAQIKPENQTLFEQDFNVTFTLESELNKAIEYFNSNATQIKNITFGDEIISEILYDNFNLDVIFYNEDYLSISGTGIFSQILPDLGIKEIKFNETGDWLSVNLESNFNLIDLISGFEDQLNKQLLNDKDIPDLFLIKYMARIEQNNVSFIKDFVINFRRVHKVTFIDFFNQTVSEKIVGHGLNVTMTIVPELENYTFIGWNDSLNNIISNKTMKALFEKNQIEFDEEDVAPEVVINSTRHEEVKITIGENSTNVTINVSGLITSNATKIVAEIPKIVINSTNIKNIIIEIPATNITSTNTSWDGIINAPVNVTDFVLPVESGKTKALETAIKVGFDGGMLTFESAVRLMFPGSSGKKVGYSQGSSPFVEITDTCSADSQAEGDALPANGNCKINVGGNLVIWTKHFTTFATYTETIVSSSGSSGSSRSSSITYIPIISNTTEDEVEIIDIESDEDKTDEVEVIDVETDKETDNEEDEITKDDSKEDDIISTEVIDGVEINVTKNRLTGNILKFTGGILGEIIGFILLATLIGFSYYNSYYGGMPWHPYKTRALNLDRKSEELYKKGKVSKSKKVRNRARMIRQYLR